MNIKLLSLVTLFFLTVNIVRGDDFIVERAVNLSQLDSWADISQFQWQEIDHSLRTLWASTTKFTGG